VIRLSLRLYARRREAILAIITLAFIAVFSHGPAGLRLATVLPAFLICPGLAIGGAARFDGPATVLRICIPLSAAISILCAQLLLSSHAFDARAGLGIVCAITTAAVAVDYSREARAAKQQ
jgi:hypothetical protein